jgi:hypothetical protein
MISKVEKNAYSSEVLFEKFEEIYPGKGKRIIEFNEG